MNGKFKLIGFCGVLVIVSFSIGWYLGALPSKVYDDLSGGGYGRMATRFSYAESLVEFPSKDRVLKSLVDDVDQKSKIIAASFCHVPDDYVARIMRSVKRANHNSFVAAYGSKEGRQARMKIANLHAKGCAK